MLLYSGESLVGRSWQATVRLQDSGVSTEHAVINIGDPNTPPLDPIGDPNTPPVDPNTPPLVTIEDLQSSYGTWVGGRRLTPYRAVPLEGTVQLSFGVVRATFHFLGDYLNTSD